MNGILKNKDFQIFKMPNAGVLENRLLSKQNISL